MLSKPQVTPENRIAIGLALSLLLAAGNLPAQAQMSGLPQALKQQIEAQQQQDKAQQDQQQQQQQQSGDNKTDQSTTPKDSSGTGGDSAKKDDASATKPGDEKKEETKAADTDKKSDKADADTKSDDTKKADKDSDDKKDETADKKDDKDKDDDKTSEEKDREKMQAKAAAEKYSPVKEAIVEINSGRAEEAIAKLEKLIGKNPKDVQARYVMAVALVRLRKYDAAANQYHEVLKLVPATSKVGQLATEGLQKIAR